MPVTSTSTGAGVPKFRICVTMSAGRSEEHTSELQSLAYLVCRLLLEKKKIVSKIHVIVETSSPSQLYTQSRVIGSAGRPPEITYVVSCIEKTRTSQYRSSHVNTSCTRCD